MRTRITFERPTPGTIARSLSVAEWRRTWVVPNRRPAPRSILPSDGLPTYRTPRRRIVPARCQRCPRRTFSTALVDADARALGDFTFARSRSLPPGHTDRVFARRRT